ncbi:MAG: protein kinase domain-containing protein [Nannocystales bacterium]
MARRDDSVPMHSDLSSLGSALRELAAAPAINVTPLLVNEGDQVGHFVIERKIGAGGMGVVYRAWDPRLERTVAIKLHRDFAGGTARLQREARAMARLSHPNVLTVFEVGTYEGEVFIAMEFAPGGSLRGWLTAQHRSPAQVLDMFVAAGRGLAAAHAIDLVHRDFKPDNVLLDAEGRPRVADFGLAHRVVNEETSASASDSEASPNPLTSVTTTLSPVGTPMYMPPEQCRGEPLTAAADQFAFCVSLYVALHAQAPFRADAAAEDPLAEIMAGRIRTPPPGRAPTRVWPILCQGLAGTPEARYPSMDALLDALERDPATARRRVGAAAALVSLTAGAVVSAQWALGDKPCIAAAEGMSALWNDEERDHVEQAYGQADIPHATSAGTLIAARLDAFANAWAASRTDACLAARVEQSQSEAMYDLRATCLDEQLATATGILRTVRVPTRNIVSRVDQVLGKLPRVSDCEDTELLRGDVAPPADAATRATVAELRSDVAELRTLLATGSRQRLERRVDALLDLAKATGYEPAEIEVRLLRADLAATDGLRERAKADYERVLSRSLASGYHRYVPRGAGGLALLVGAHQSTAAEGARLLRIAQGALERRPDPNSQRYLAEVGAQLAVGRGELTTALTLIEEALAVKVEMSEGDDVAAWTQRIERARILSLMGRGDEARREGEQVIEALQTRHGPTDSRLLFPLGFMANLDAQHGDLEGAARRHTRRVSIAQETQGESYALLRALRDQGMVLGDLERADEALASIDRAVTLFRKLDEQDPLELARTLSTRGSVLGIAKRCDDAIDTFERADAAFETADRLHGEFHVESLQNRTYCLLDARGAHAAWVHTTELVEVAARLNPEGSMPIVRTRIVAAQMANAAQQWDSALSHSTRGLRGAQTLSLTAGLVPALLRLEQADAFRGLERHDDARRSLLQTLEALRADHPSPQLFAENLVFVAARLVADPADFPLATEAVEEAEALTVGVQEPWADKIRRDVARWREQHPRP